MPTLPPISRLDSAKRRVVRQLAEENLAELEGRPARSGSRLGTLAVRLSGLAVPVIAALAVLAQAGPVSPSRAGVAGVAGLRSPGVIRVEPTAWPRPVVASAASTQPSPVPGPASEPPGEDLVFPAPVPLDGAVFPLSVRTVVLDPGHGGNDNPGTMATSGLAEKDLTLDIARRLRALLGRAGYRVLMTRDGDGTVTLDERTRFANDSRADIFVSIHVNWLGESRRGIETFFLGPTEDPYLTHLASRENRDSGYSLAALKQILEGVYANLRQEESRKLAEAVHKKLYAHLREVAPGTVDRGVKTAPFVVLVGTEMPAILAEVSALSSREEAGLLELPAYREYIALALFSGISSYARSVDEPEYQEG